jgi:hypothetical protein
MMKRISLIIRAPMVSLIAIARGSELPTTGRKTVVPGSLPNAKTWAVTLEQDPETGELILPFPTDLLNQMGWSEGTDIWWDVQDNGSVVIREKKEEDEKDTSDGTSRIR